MSQLPREQMSANKLTLNLTLFALKRQIENHTFYLKHPKITGYVI